MAKTRFSLKPFLLAPCFFLQSWEAMYSSVKVAEFRFRPGEIKRLPILVIKIHHCVIFSKMMFLKKAQVGAYLSNLGCMHFLEFM